MLGPHGRARTPPRRHRSPASSSRWSANFAYIYPVLTDQLLPYGQWLARMWLRSWI